jgi:hypothetical protein
MAVEVMVGVSVAVGGATVGVSVAGAGLGTIKDKSSKHTWVGVLSFSAPS